MGHVELIARKTVDALQSVGYACGPGDDAATFVIRKWGARVTVFEGNAREEPGQAALFPAVVVFHRHLPGGWARELAVGMGTTTSDAVNAISASWMLLFFAPLKFVFEPDAHDCTVHEQPLQLPRAHGAGYRLFAGPVQMLGFGEAGQVQEISQSLLWNAFADALLPRLGRGVHHVRCYVGKFGGKVSADVFVDGEEWPDGSQALRDLAATFPEPDDAHPIYALKQHLFIRPADLDAESAAAEDEQITAWKAAIDDQLDDAHRGLARHVLRGVYVIAPAGVDEDEQERSLIERGTPPDVAAALVAFLPSAAARVLLDGQAEFSPTYHWKNRRTGRAVERRYDQTPVFTAALHVLGLLNRPGVAAGEVEAVASGSAEVNAVRQAAAQQGSLTGGARFTAMIHHTDEEVDGDVLPPPTPSRPSPPPAAPNMTGAPSKPWWKFW